MSSTSRTSLPSTSVIGAAFDFNTGSPKVRIEYVVIHARLSRVSHYFDETPAVGSDEVVVDVALPDVGFTMVTDRGVFSRGHLDSGTSLLLRAAPPPSATGDLLDLGCGAGPIALTLALRSPNATVWAVDTNERARSLTERNCARNGIVNVRVCAPSDVPADVRFSTIWSNPPIRIGKAQLRDLLAGWLGRLADDGEAVLVVQKHLGADSLQRWLTDESFPTERIASRGGFRLLRSTNEHTEPPT
ncbi:MAG: methyltransferase [Ilumatobacter sp.]|nr:methyltransferase [Ilumatobacter sp.]